MKRLFCGVFLALMLSLSVLAVSLCVTRVQSGAKSTIAESYGANWLSGWVYRKPHTIMGSSTGDQVNYQLLVCVHYGYGADSEGDVYLNGGCRIDFGDVRFTDSSGANSLNYWILNQVNGVQAVIWIKIGLIPVSPNQTRMYIYYGNPNASTTSNRDLTLDSASDFEDGTMQGWSISWSSYVSGDGVDSITAYDGNFSRFGGRTYGTSGGAGTGEFYERIRKTGVYLASGSYTMEGAACFVISDIYRVPTGLKLMVDENVVSQMDNPGTSWQPLTGHFTLNSSRLVTLSFEFHLSVSSGLITGPETYRVDSIFVHKWCDPEPAQGSWGSVEGSADNIPPTVSNALVTPTAPYPFVPSSNVRQGEPILVTANVTDNDSGVGLVVISYENNLTSQDEWTNTTMVFNATAGLWSVVLPGQPGGAAVLFFFTAYDNAGNQATSSTTSFFVQPLIPGDINGDGKVSLSDLVLMALHYGQHYP